jgi:hypothetical protein
VAICSVVFAVCGLGWYLRTFLLTGNPVYPERLGRAVSHLPQGDDSPDAVERFTRLPWRLVFAGQNYFDCVTPNPLGVTLAVFLPFWVFVRRRRKTAEAVAACFVGVYLVYWAITWVYIRHAIPALSLLTAMLAWRVAEDRRLVTRLATAWCLLFALLPVMIQEINAPQIRYFARRLNRDGYLREAIGTYRSLEFLRRNARPGEPVYSIGNCSRLYAPAPEFFLCPMDRTPEQIRGDLVQGNYPWVILPASLAQPLPGLRPVYADESFRVYRGPAVAR